jgi:predicted nicotinamide N-methyase
VSSRLLSVDEEVLIPAALSAVASRSISVELRAGLVFQMLEVLGQPRPSHWARVWPTSVAMSRWLLEQRVGSLPLSATELGCGMGLVSMTLAFLGLIIEGTDREPLALAFAMKNALRNGLLGFSASTLEWSDGVGVPTSLLVASDVVYEAGAPELLFALVETQGLLSPGGRLLLGVPHARTELLDTFVNSLQLGGYSHSEEPRAVDWEGREEAIDVHVLTRPLS